MKAMTSLVFAACLALSAAAAAQTTAVPADAAGTWNATFNTQDGAMNATLKIGKSGEKLAGTIGSKEGETPIEAELKGNALSVWFNYSHNGQPIPIEMTGTIDGDSAKGTMTASGNPAGDWSASRAKDTKEPKAAADTKDAKEAGVSGAWNASLQLDTITATPSFTLKQDGTRLTGEYVSQQYGKFPLSGEVTGTAVTFTVAMNIEGNAINAVYSGVLQADGTLKGSVDVGGMMSGSFTATRAK